MADNRIPVVFLSQYFWPEETATAEVISGISFALRSAGYEVGAIAGHPIYRGESLRLPAVIEERGVRIERVTSTQMNKNRTIGRVLNTVTFVVALFFRLLFMKRPFTVVALTNPPLLPWLVWALKLLRRVPYVLVIHDVYPQVAVAVGKIKARGMIDRLWRALNRVAYRGAEHIIVLGDCMKETLVDEAGSDRVERITAIPNWADGDEIRPRAPEAHPLLREWNLEGKFIVQYAGNIGLCQDIAIIADAAEQLRDHSDIHFLFIGSGGQLPFLEERMRERKLENITVIPYQPIATRPLWLTACHAGIVTMKSEVTGLCVPSKLYGIMAAGKPVVAIVDERCESARAVRRHRCGIVVSPGDGATLAREIVELARSRENVEALGARARAAFEKHYTLQQITAQYADLLDMGAQR